MSDTPWRDPDGVWVADPERIIILQDVETFGGASVIDGAGRSATVIRLDVVVQVGDERADKVMHLLFPRAMVPDLMRAIRKADQFMADNSGPVT